MINNQFSKKITIFRFGIAGEFESNKWVTYGKNKGIINEYTSLYSPS